MTDELNHIIYQLKNARYEKHITQGKLAEKLGIPQSHISKIESGNVDLRLSSLIEIARTLELELVLVPIKHLTLINAILQGHSILDDLPAYIPDGDPNDDVF